MDLLTMSNGEKVTLKDVYEISNRVETKLDKISDRVDTLEIWRAEITGKVAVIGSLIIFGASFVIDWIKDRLKI